MEGRQTGAAAEGNPEKKRGRKGDQIDRGSWKREKERGKRTKATMEEEKNEGTKQSWRRSHWSSGSDNASDSGTDIRP